MNSVLQVMSNHCSIRKFVTKDIPKEVLLEILKAARWASTSSNLQAYSIIVVKDQEKKSNLATLCGNQKYVAECPVFLVFCGDLSRVRYASETYQKPAHLDYVEPFLVASIDAALLAQNVMLAAESSGLGGVYIGGIRNNSQQVSELLNLPDYVYPVFGMCLGFPDETAVPGQKPRLPLEAIIHEEEYDEAKLEAVIEEYDEITEEYYRNRPSAARNQSWSEYISNIYKEPKRVHLKEFLGKKGLGLK
ncbi:MAG: oxygen-insensitive NADPH nitroreductase [Bacillus sp. (in: firmicutes)]